MTARGTLLLVEDEQKIRRVLGQALRGEGHDVLEAGSVREAQQVLSERSVDVQVTRLRKKLGGGKGAAALIRTVRGAGYAIYPEAADAL